MARKRKHAAFQMDDIGPGAAVVSPENDVDEDAHCEQSASASAASVVTPGSKWELVASKKSRRQQGQDGGDDKNNNRNSNSNSKNTKLYPAFTFSKHVTAPLRIKDLQALVLYLLSDGPAPQWVATQNAKSIDRVLVLMVSGLDKATVESFVEKSANSTGRLHTIPVKLPGDRKSGRFHSALQAMLISPEPKKTAKDRKRPSSHQHNKADAFPSNPTPITRFLLSADAMAEADFCPIHPAILDGASADAEREQARRKSAGQSSEVEEDGWLDSNVDVAQPVTNVPAKNPASLNQGLEVLSLDCEMVLTTDDKFSLARISVINWLGKTVLDKYVRPSLPIKDYFTQYSGITPKILQNVTTTLQDIQKELLSLLTPSTILVGHSLESDFKALKMTHPFVVDTSLLYPHPGGLPLRSSLKFLANKYLKREIQTGRQGHDSVEDARATLDLVRLKCEKGPDFGLGDAAANGESVFTRFARAGRKTAIIDYGNPERSFAQQATVKIACQDDDEIERALVDILSGKGVGNEPPAFIWARLRELEKARGWDSNKDRCTPSTSSAADEDNKIKSAANATVERLCSIYQALPCSTALLIYHGAGDMSEVSRLQNMRKEYHEEFKVKKWDELTVQWTDKEEQALRQAFDHARQGWGVLGLSEQGR